MKMFRWLTIVAMMLSVGAGAAMASDDAPYTELTAQELVALQAADPLLVIIDSRGGKYFDGEMIKNAVQLSVTDTSAETLAALAPNKATQIVFYCSNTTCSASSLAAYKAAHAGYTSLYKYPAGIEDWKTRGLPTTHIQ